MYQFYGDIHLILISAYYLHSFAEYLREKVIDLG